MFRYRPGTVKQRAGARSAPKHRHPGIGWSRPCGSGRRFQRPRSSQRLGIRKPVSDGPPPCTRLPLVRRGRYVGFPPAGQDGRPDRDGAIRRFLVAQKRCRLECNRALCDTHDCVRHRESRARLTMAPAPGPHREIARRSTPHSVRSGPCFTRPEPPSGFARGRGPRRCERGARHPISARWRPGPAVPRDRRGRGSLLEYRGRRRA